MELLTSKDDEQKAIYEHLHPFVIIYPENILFMSFKKRRDADKYNKQKLHFAGEVITRPQAIKRGIR